MAYRIMRGLMGKALGTAPVRTECAGQLSWDGIGWRAMIG